MMQKKCTGKIYEEKVNIDSISENNFGIRITDNLPKEIVNHLWLKNFPQETRDSLSQIKDMANDSYEITIKEFFPGKPCEVWLKKGLTELKKLYITFVTMKEKEVKRGRPKKHPDSMIKDIFTPTQFKELIAKTLTEFSS